MEFLKLVDQDNVKLLVDAFHMNIEEDDICAALENSYIGCIHVSENHRGVPGTGHIDWKQIVSVLKKQGYEGYLDMETFVKIDHGERDDTEVNVIDIPTKIVDLEKFNQLFYEMIAKMK